MATFERAGACEKCGREYVLRGNSANPTNETQLNVEFTCECGGILKALIPGSANRDLVHIQPRE
jgi:hypothetical protein